MNANDSLHTEWLVQLRGRYDRYVDGYRDSDGRLPQMMQLKYEHTMKVVQNAELIAKAEGFSPAEHFAAVAASLLHDTGRYEQLKRYNTFRDADSVDHAVFSHDIAKSQNWLRELTEPALAAPFEKPILSAVLYHNRRDLPDSLDPLTAIAANAVRDADKLDIFRVLETEIANSDWHHDRSAFWNLPYGIAPNPRVIEAIRAHRPVDYHDVRSFADFVLIQVGWMISGLAFAASRRLCLERRHLDFRRRFLREIGGGDEADAICDLAEEIG